MGRECFPDLGSMHRNNFISHPQGSFLTLPMLTWGASYPISYAGSILNSHTISDTSKFFPIRFFFKFLCITSRPSAASFVSFFLFFKCIWVTLPQHKSKHCLYAVPTVVIKRQQILWNLSYMRVWGELNLETVRTTTALNCWTTSPALVYCPLSSYCRDLNQGTIHGALRIFFFLTVSG